MNEAGFKCYIVHVFNPFLTVWELEGLWSTLCPCNFIFMKRRPSPFKSLERNQKSPASTPHRPCGVSASHVAPYLPLPLITQTEGSSIVTFVTTRGTMLCLSSGTDLFWQGGSVFPKRFASLHPRPSDTPHLLVPLIPPHSVLSQSSIYSWVVLVERLVLPSRRWAAGRWQ